VAGIESYCNSAQNKRKPLVIMKVDLSSGGQKAGLIHNGLSTGTEPHPTFRLNYQDFFHYFNPQQGPMVFLLSWKANSRDDSSPEKAGLIMAYLGFGKKPQR
jgi:hypothetical protein